MSLALIKWTRDPQFWSAERAEHAVVGNYEIVAFDLPPTAGFPTRDIGWELFGPPNRRTQLACTGTGDHQAPLNVVLGGPCLRGHRARGL
jgi:hypothetical protein